MKMRSFFNAISLMLGLMVCGLVPVYANLTDAVNNILDTQASNMQWVCILKFNYRQSAL